jgi:sensor histidine kinase YesM
MERTLAGRFKPLLGVIRVIRNAVPPLPLSQEIQIVRAYLEVEQQRLGDRLRVEFHVDEAVLDLPVPVLSLQPLLENAIKHGIAQSAEPGLRSCAD